MIKVAIKGLGLIGSSLALALKKSKLDLTIYGLDQKQASLDYALAKGIIDDTLTDLTNLEMIDYLFLAGPVSVILDDITTLNKVTVKDSLVVMDVGSSKNDIMTAAKLIQNKVNFIGGHPMAGSHKSGVEAGRSDLFENAFFFLMPLDNKAATKLPALKELLSETKAKWQTVTPKQHDLIVGQISHLPHIIASALVNQTQGLFADEPLGLRVAAGGFKSITRIAAANPTMWTDICFSNKQVLLEKITAYKKELDQIKAQLVSGDQKAVYTFFAHARQTRLTLEQNNQKVSRPDYDLFLNIPDRPGEIAKITQQLAQAGLNLVNIQILEVREDINGVLQLTFSTEVAFKKAQSILQVNYEIVKREVE